ncbi:MAG: hypothetical protein QOF09_112 [Alphaproteobacteria bacterium]|nr:hypothetical protein [Alphaproteobacteria bacterium]
MRWHKWVEYLVGGINAMDLKDRLSNVETERRDRLHGLLL